MQFGAFEVCASQIGVVEVHVTERDTTEIGTDQARLSQESLAHL
jgi:hypothetical protein